MTRKTLATLWKRTRSIAFIAGPYVKQHTLVSTDYNTINFVRTIEEMLGLDPLNVNGSAAQSVADVFDADAYPALELRGYTVGPSV
jgi:hypothetical protein